MDTTPFTSDSLPPLTLAEARRRRRSIMHEIGMNAPVFIGIMDLFTNAGISIKTPEGYYVYKNPYAIEAANLSREDDFLGKRAQDIYPTKLWHVYVEREEAVLRTGKPFVNRLRGYANDRSNALCTTSAFPLRNAHGKTIGLLTVFRRTKTDQQSPGWNNQIREAIKYVSEHYAEHVRLQELASVAKMSVSTFQRLFTSLMNEPPSRYLTRTRINAAKVLLGTTDKLIADIATETGFFDQSHFIKTFKQSTGLTPAHYRRQHLGI